MSAIFHGEILVSGGFLGGGNMSLPSGVSSYLLLQVCMDPQKQIGPRKGIRNSRCRYHPICPLPRLDLLFPLFHKPLSHCTPSHLYPTPCAVLPWHSCTLPYTCPISWTAVQTGLLAAYSPSQAFTLHNVGYLTARNSHSGGKLSDMIVLLA